MRLTDILTGGQLKNASTQASSTQSVSNQGGTASVGRQIQALAPGQTLQGEVVSKDGNQVQIKVADDFILEAKVDQDMNLQVGKTMTFEVRNNGQTLTLSPLFTNTATQANALKALEMANLPVNTTTVTMTGLLMDAGLPIDRNSLQQIFREVNNFPEAAVSDVVDLHKFGLAVNEENLQQISSYKNLTHQLVDGMHTVVDSLPESMQSMVDEGNLDGAAKLFSDLLDMVQGLPNEEVEGLAGQVNIEEAVIAQEGNPKSSEVVNEVSREETDATANGIANETSGNGTTQVAESDLGRTQAAETELLSNSQTEGVTEGAQSLSEAVLALVKENIPEGQENAYMPLLQQLTQASAEGDTATQATVMKAIVEQAVSNQDKDLAAQLITDKGVQKFLAQGLEKLWTIEPKDVADPNKVENLYARLSRQLNQLSQSLQENGQEQSAAFKAVNNMNQNLDFLQQINEAYTYVQLPLRLQQGDAHGDLYVYTNKRNLAAKDGQISALLHLDMEHLGPVDVYVAMQAEKVNTKFYVQDDDMLDFLESHMDLLTARLQKRGYNCDFTMQVKEQNGKKNSGIQGLMSENSAKPIAQYAFDVRA